jgi:hypothetical protein
LKIKSTVNSYIIGSTLALFVSTFVFQFALYYDSSDVHNYIENHNNFEYSGMNVNYILYQDLTSSYIFYKVMQFISSMTKDEVVSLQLLCFISTLFFVQPIISSLQKSNTYYYWKVLCILCILIHPKFLTLVTSNIRGSLSIGFVFYGLQQSSKIKKIIFLSFAPFLHLSSLVVIQIYCIYLLTNSKYGIIKTKKTTVIYLLNSLVLSIYLIINVKEKINPGGTLYLVAIISVLIILLRNTYKFSIQKEMALPISLIVITLGTYMYQFGGIRFFSYALPFLSMGCTKIENKECLKNITSIFAVFSLVGLYYWLIFNS